MAKIKKFDELSDDIEKLDFTDINNDGGEPETDWIIDEVLDVSLDDPDETNENAITLHSDLSNRETKRGDIIWITALVKRKNGSINNPAKQAVIKCRVVDIFFGLHHLSKVINK